MERIICYSYMAYWKKGQVAIRLTEKEYVINGRTVVGVARDIGYINKVKYIVNTNPVYRTFIRELPLAIEIEFKALLLYNLKYRLDYKAYHQACLDYENAVRPSYNI